MLFIRCQCYINIEVCSLSILGFNKKSMYFCIISTSFNIDTMLREHCKPILNFNGFQHWSTLIQYCVLLGHWHLSAALIPYAILSQFPIECVLCCIQGASQGPGSLDMLIFTFVNCLSPPTLIHAHVYMMVNDIQIIIISIQKKYFLDLLVITYYIQNDNEQP